VDEYPRQYLYRRVVRAKLFIDAHFAESIDLDNVAGEACFSKFHFARTFKEIYDRTPHQYLTDVRISHAKDLLRDGRTVAAACFGVGFDSVSSFTGLFKRRVGMTPAAFQREQLVRQAKMADRPIAFVPGCFAENHGWRE
jgi:AraC-like DNA-binding protein